MKKKLLVYEIIGIFFSIILGASLHFAFEWSGYSKIVALIAAVNESTWEHLKLGFGPLLFWAGFEYLAFKGKLKNFALAKGLALLSFCLLVPVFFYSYQAITGSHSLIFDVSTFMISVIIAHLVSYFILKKTKEFNLNYLGKAIIIVLLVAFMSLSFFPLKIFLFQDPVTGGYGIVN